MLQPFDWQLILITAALARIDGQFSYFEEHKIKRTFKHFFDSERQDLACKSVAKVNVESISWSILLDEFNAVTSKSDRIHLITFLFEVACTDASLADEELSFIHQVSKDFKVKELEFLQILEKYKMWNKTFRSKELDRLNQSIETQKQNEKFRALTVFGLTINANNEQVKKRYRELVKKHHPDAHPNLTSSELIFHRKQLFKINKAYETLLG
jgi:DnaJ-domain-containing protein 1